MGAILRIRFVFFLSFYISFFVLSFCLSIFLSFFLYLFLLSFYLSFLLFSLRWIAFCQTIIVVIKIVANCANFVNLFRQRVQNFDDLSKRYKILFHFDNLYFKSILPCKNCSLLKNKLSKILIQPFPFLFLFCYFVDVSINVNLILNLTKNENFKKRLLEPIKHQRTV